MASIKSLLGTDSIKESRLTLNGNFAALNQELTEISELLVNFEGGGGSSFSGIISSHLIPNQTETFDLGSPLLRFRDIYLSNNTIYLGTSTISGANGNIELTNSGGGTFTVVGNSTVSTLENGNPEEEFPEEKEGKRCKVDISSVNDTTLKGNVESIVLTLLKNDVNILIMLYRKPIDISGIVLPIEQTFHVDTKLT